MKIKLITISCLIIILATNVVKAQNYNPVINYALNGTPLNGIKIKTNLPFTNGSQMPTLIIEGYNYGEAKTIGLILTWYIYNNNFLNQKISSFGDYTPNIKLANENGFVVIFINDKQYFNRFSIRAYAQGRYEQSSWFASWSVSDEAISGSNITEVPYSNSFGNTFFNGKLGIGTKTLNHELEVNGTIHAREVKIDVAFGADFVFAPTYKLRTLTELEQFVKTNNHLPEIPSATEMQKEGVSVSDMQTKLLQKVEELTLYMIELKKENEQLKSEIKIK